MYLYEEYDLSGLQSSPDVDDGPDKLYAMAQCFRLGRGVEPDGEMAREYLRMAADAGSEPARRELEGQRPAPIPEAPLRDYSGLDLLALKELEEQEDLGARLELLCRYTAAGDLGGAERCAGGCARLAMEGRMDLRLRRAALEAAGDFYQDRDRAESRRLYELARELGSDAACGRLLDYYTCGLGGPIDLELAEDCVCQMERQGGRELLYKAAAWRAGSSGGGPSLEARENLKRLKDQTEEGGPQ